MRRIWSRGVMTFAAFVEMRPAFDDEWSAR